MNRPMKKKMIPAANSIRGLRKSMRREEQAGYHAAAVAALFRGVAASKGGAL
jgi:hypothetical protein